MIIGIIFLFIDLRQEDPCLRQAGDELTNRLLTS
jgi:hypothetical protein